MKNLKRGIAAAMACTLLLGQQPAWNVNAAGIEQESTDNDISLSSGVTSESNTWHITEPDKPAVLANTERPAEGENLGYQADMGDSRESAEGKDSAKTNNSESMQESSEEEISESNTETKREKIDSSGESVQDAAVQAEDPTKVDHKLKKLEENVKESANESAIINDTEQMPKTQSNGLYTVSGNKITVKVKNGANIGHALSSALKEATELGSSKNIYTVIVPKGSYKLDEILHVYGNVTLDLSAGVTLECVMSKGNMLMLGDSKINTDKKKMKGYGTCHNITVLGGTWKGNNKNSSSLIRMAHSKNVRFEGCVITGGGCAHQMEVAAIDGFVVKDCTFKDMPGNGTDEKQEALQLDIPCGEYIFGGTVLDGTPLKNVTITGCNFKNVPRGLGSHSMIVGVYFRNITITDNTFDNVAEECIVCLNYSDCVVSGNVIKNSGAGILFQYFKPNVQSVYKSIYDGKQKVDYPVEHDAKTTIKNNTITVVPSKAADKSVAIKVYGEKLEKDTRAIGFGSKDLIPKNDYYVSGVTVEKNTITSSGHGIQFFDVKSSKILNNKIICTGKKEYDGIFLEFASKKITVEGNTVNKAPRYGICLQGKSSAKNIVNNKIASSGSYGIYLYDSSVVSGNIQKNTIRNSKSAGIFLNKKSKAAMIAENTISQPKEKGIYILNNSEVTDSIRKNTITKGKDRGISVEKNSKVKKIVKNTITDNANYGIYLYNGAKVTGTIAENKISNCKMSALFLNNKCSTGSINGNIIMSANGKAIYVLSNSTVKNEISGNKISKASKEGINVCSTKNNLSIKDNLVSGCSSWPVYLNTDKSHKVSVQDNTLTSKKANTVIQVSGGTMSIKNNTLSNGKWGVCMNPGTKGLIGYNKLTKNEFNVYMIRGNQDKGVKATNNESQTVVSSLKSGNKKQITLKWKKISGHTGYVIEYATKKDFSNAKNLTVPSGNTKTIKGLKGKTKYFVRVCACKKVNGITVYQKYSKAKEVTVK